MSPLGVLGGDGGLPVAIRLESVSPTTLSPIRLNRFRQPSFNVSLGCNFERNRNRLKIFWRLIMVPIVFAILAWGSLRRQVNTGAQVAIVWPANAIAILVLIRTETWRSGLLELSLIMFAYLVVALGLVVKLDFPVSFSFVMCLSHAVEIGISAYGLRFSSWAIDAWGGFFVVKDMLSIWFFAGFLGPFVSFLVSAFTFLWVDYDMAEYMMEGCVFSYVSRHGSTNAIRIWGITLMLATACSLRKDRVMAPSTWGVTWKPVAEFVSCLIVMGFTTYFAAIQRFYTLYLLLLVMCAWVAFRFSQVLTSGVQMATYIFIVATWTNFSYTSDYVGNKELNLLLYVTACVSCFISALQFQNKARLAELNAKIKDYDLKYAELLKSKEEMVMVVTAVCCEEP